MRMWDKVGRRNLVNAVLVKRGSGDMKKLKQNNNKNKK
jgi:hypothetical protein